MLPLHQQLKNLATEAEISNEVCLSEDRARLIVGDPDVEALATLVSAIRSLIPLPPVTFADRDRMVRVYRR